MDLKHIYSCDIPDLITELCSCSLLQRLKNVGMNCGCEYTNFTHFRHIGGYSRFEHSVGVALIIWNFTHDQIQTVAGLLHDISTPVFAHVIDFLHNDHMTQEYTEDLTESMILGSEEICSILRKYGIDPHDVTDYHRYPVADNDSPKLSADRLEYSLGNIVNYGFESELTVQQLYSDIVLGINEFGEPELMFNTSESAVKFSELALKCSEVYVCDEDRYSMQMLSELIKDAVSAGLFTEKDLYRTEPEIISILESDPVFSQRWNYFRSYSEIVYNPDEKDRSRRLIRAKKRYINPFIEGLGRVTEISDALRSSISDFLSRPQDYYISGTNKAR